MAEIGRFGQRWQKTELALFGSALRDDFGPAVEVSRNWRLKQEILKSSLVIFQK